ncbi:MAG: bacteriophage holin [Candidatus Woesearchaeota archaeon]|nr:MAG: bacteriophage holin [Candidatus Woesearchaeota archaeon]
MKINPKIFGLTGGIMWGICMFVMTLAAVATGYSEGILNIMATIYPGYSISIAGAFIGLIFGFIDMFIGLYIFAWLYNYLDKKLGTKE